MVNPDVQAQLQEEIDFVFDGKEEGEDLSADDLTNMPYLEQVNNSQCKLVEVEICMVFMYLYLGS